MLRQEVCQICCLTKKALRYYEEKGLIAPRVLENGYRDYEEKEIQILKEIAVLRNCGLCIAEIKTVLRSADKTAALASFQCRIGLQKQRLDEMQACAASLTESYNIDQAFHEMQEHQSSALTLKERFLLAFPGWYGMFLSLHFGRFLEEKIETEDQRKAYREVIRYLDGVEFAFPSDLEQVLAPLLKADPVRLEEDTNAQMAELAEDTAGYLERNREAITGYLSYRRSEEFQNSPGGRLQTYLSEFQKQSGYRERLIENMKLLSPSYREYLATLEAANEEANRLMPELKDLNEPYGNRPQA